MWKLIEFLAAGALILVAFTEFFYPVFTGKPIFGSFRRKAKSNTPDEPVDTMEKKLDEAREKINDVKSVQNEVEKNYKAAEQLKKESDNLMK